MSNRDLAVSVRGLSKSYTIAHNAPKHTTMAEALLHTLKKPGAKPKAETFWALKDIDFDINKGEVVGVIGRNGAGKSTLLKVLSRITEPTSGQIDLYGRVGSLLEVGTGFHPELTGRENIYMNGSILGMTKREITKHFDEIVEFSGTEQFLDTPVKRYSSGMYVRLAFAVAAHLNPEILIVDEVLSVGDAEFQKKCLGKMQDVAQQEGRTVLFVSHSMQSISMLCDKGIYLKTGQIAYVGDVQSAIEHYLGAFSSSVAVTSNQSRRIGSGEYRFNSVRPIRELFDSAGSKEFIYTIERKRGACGHMYLGAHIINNQGFEVAQCDSRLIGFWIGDSDVIEGSFKFASPWLKPGQYRLNISLCLAGSVIDFCEDACTFEISPMLPFEYSGSADSTQSGLVFADFAFSETSDLIHV